MNVGKSIKHALINKGWGYTDLSERMELTAGQIGRLANQESCKGAVIKKLADAFDMPVSEFIALGE